jgi:hypothetical protein
MAADLTGKFAEITSREAFYRLVDTAPSDSYQSTQQTEKLSPLVRDFAVAMICLVDPDKSGNTWHVSYDNLYDMRLLRVAEPDHNNPAVAVHGYSLTIADRSGHSVLEARCYAHKNMRDGDVSREFIATARNNGLEATALHRDFFKPLKQVFEGKLQQKLAAAAPVAA